MVPTYSTLLAACQPFFVPRRTFVLFCQLVDAWLLCPTRRTITGLVAGIPGADRRAHDAYHHLFQAAVWEPDELFDGLTGRLVRTLCPDGVLTCDIDDTLHHKHGPKVTGAGVWRDAVRSTRQQTVYARGLNLVVLTLRVTPPWGGFPLALPLRVRLHRKGGPTYLDLAEAAALGLFSLTTMTRCQQTVERLIYSRTVIWGQCTVLLVIVRDPTGREKDDCFVTTALDACALDVPDHYGGRWSIEVTFRDIKQHLGTQEPQCWADAGPVRAASLAYWLYSLVWYSFLCADAAEQRRALPQCAWYAQKAVPSFADALAWLRRSRWQARITAGAGAEAAPAYNPETVDLLIDHVTRVA
ncbi:MAG: transposase [Armatimonadota bacterium]